MSLDEAEDKLRSTPWPIAVRHAITDAQREGYLMALADVETCLYGGVDIAQLVRGALELRVAMSGRRDA
jgi:hypothetical protein